MASKIKNFITLDPSIANPAACLFGDGKLQRCEFFESVSYYRPGAKNNAYRIKQVADWFIGLAVMMPPEPFDLVIEEVKPQARKKNGNSILMLHATYMAIIRAAEAMRMPDGSNRVKVIELPHWQWKQGVGMTPLKAGRWGKSWKIKPKHDFCVSLLREGLYRVKIPHTEAFEVSFVKPRKQDKRDALCMALHWWFLNRR